MPPATPNVPLAPDGVPVIQPRAVTKSPVVHEGAPRHTMSACAEDTTTSATPVTTTCRALTVMSPGEPDCSLITTLPRPAGSRMVWLGEPDTTIGVPLIPRLTISDDPPG